MSSPEEQKFILDLISSYIKPWRPHMSAEDAELQDPSGHAPVETLCLRRTELTDIGGSIVNHHMLKYLYLEGNNISSIPESFFINLPRLRWLDLRNNQISVIPTEIGSHTSLQTLLLEGNPISELPPELGNVITLTGLNLRYCPITFPPQDVVDQGVQSILQYLRGALARRPVSEKKILPAELPEVEKLHLSEVADSSVEEQDESVDEDELRRFRELQRKMILLDRAEQGLITRGGGRSGRPPAQKKKASVAKPGVIPKLSLLDSCHGRKAEEREQVAQRDPQKRQTCFGPARKNQDSFHKWRTQAKITQEKEISRHRLWVLDKQEEAEADVRAAEEVDRDSRWSQSVTEYVESTCEGPVEPRIRSGTEWEQRIYTHVEKTPGRHRNPRGTGAEQMAAAGQDGEEIERVQSELRDGGGNNANVGGITTGNTWQRFLQN